METQLASGNIDCALGFDPLCVNAERYSVGVTYMESDIVLAVRPESEINRIRDLKERRIGTLDDPALTAAIQGSEKLVKYAAGATAYASLTRCVEALDDAWCSAIVVDSLMLTYY
ncbi:MAG: transporter substrate-binding domain-containing protein [Oscillospiraceae bacterium]|nr:transporter substrate-binding domain-containing protein [Oscillospiraceae bacterium]